MQVDLDEREVNVIFGALDVLVKQTGINGSAPIVALAQKLENLRGHRAEANPIPQPDPEKEIPKKK